MPCNLPASSLYFYPRPPRGGRLYCCILFRPSRIFLSTPSARRATFVLQHMMRRLINFYPRPPRGGRPRWFSEGDGCESISIHALREEGDNCWPRSSWEWNNFYPRPPRGGRRDEPCNAVQDCKFLSTPSARRATHITIRASACAAISIHALREEGDLRRKLKRLRLRFLSTPSARRATQCRPAYP